MTSNARLAQVSDVPKEVAWAQTQFQADADLRRAGSHIVDYIYSHRATTNPFIEGKRVQRICENKEVGNG